MVRYAKKSSTIGERLQRDKENIKVMLECEHKSSMTGYRF